MGVDLASIGLAMDSRPVVEGTKALDALADSAAKVEPKVDSAAKAVDGLGAANDRTKPKVAESSAAVDALSEASARAALGIANTATSIDALGASSARAKASASESAKSFDGLGESSINVWRRGTDAAKSVEAIGEASSRAGQKITVSNGQMADTAKILQAQAEQAKLAAQANVALGGSTTQLTLGQQQLIERFREQAATIGMSRSQLMAYQAAQLGVTEQTKSAVAAVKAHEDALKAANKAKEDAAKSSNVLTDALKLLAAGYAALKIGEYIKDSALMAARYETLGVVLEVVGKTAGYTKTQMESASDVIARQGITMLESRNSAIKLVQAHVDLSNASGLARIAQDAAVIGNINSSEAFERLVNGISRGNVLILRNIGINVNLQSAYVQMADSLGKTTKELTENERVQARLNAVIERGADIAGTYEAAMGTAGKQILSMNRYVSDLKTTFGETFNEVLTIAVMGLTDNLKDANGEVSQLAKNGQLAEWGHDLTKIFVVLANEVSNAFTTFQKFDAWARHLDARKAINADANAQSKAVSDSGNGMAEKDAFAKVQRIEAVRRAALAEENADYVKHQAELSGNFDRFQRAADERMATRLAKQKKDADERLKVDQDYAARAQALLIVNAGKSIEVQQAAQAKLAKEVYVGTPTFRDTEGRAPKDKVDQADNTRLQDHLKRIETEAQKEKDHAEFLMKLDDLRHKAGELGDGEYYANRRANLASIADAEYAMYGKELSALRAHHNSTKEEAAKNERAIHDIIDKQAGARRKFWYEELTQDEETRLRNEAMVSASDTAANKYTTTLQQQLVAIEAATGKRERSKSAIEAETVAIYEQAVANMKLQVSAPITSTHTEADRDAAAAMLLQLEKELDMHRKIGAALHEQDAYRAQRKAADQAIADWQRAGNSIANSLSSAFGEGGKALGGMFKAFADNAARQLQLNKELKDSTRGLDANDPEAIAAADRAHREMATSQVKSYGDMADAAKGFFTEGSRGYAAMDAAAKIMHATEVALSLVKGVNAVLTQGEGDPYSAFARMAAMAAAVAALGVAIGGVSGSDTTAKDRQAVVGTGSVLGDPKAKSESISKSLDAIDKNTYQGLTVSVGMLDALRAIQSGINGLGALVARNYGMGSGSPFAGLQDSSHVIGGSLATGSAAIIGGIGGAAAGASYGMAVGSIGGPIGMAIGAVIGAAIGFIASKLTKTTTEVLDSGLDLYSQTLGSIVTNGVKGVSYADIKSSTKFLGIGVSSHTNHPTQQLDDETQQQFGKVIAGLHDGVVAAATVLGQGGADFLSRLDNFSIDIGKISLKGLKPDEITAALAAAFSKAGDDMAKFAVTGLQQFQKAGEGYLETLTRVANDYQTTDVVLQSLGMTFRSVGMDSVAARERLVELSGGLDKFTSGAGQFLKDFYTEQEQAAALKERIQPTLAKYGLSTDGTDAMKVFRDLVKGLDTTTEAGAQAYTTLVGISSSFKMIVDAGKQATEAVMDAASGLLGNVDTAFSVVQSVVDRQKALVQTDIDNVTELITKHKSLSESLHSTLDAMKDPSTEKADRVAAQAQIAAALATAKAGGPLPDADKLKKSLSIVSQDVTNQFSTLQDYQRYLYGTKNDINDLAKLSDASLSTEEKSLEELKSQAKQLDKMLESAQEQVNELKGISTTGLTLVQAMEGLRTAILSAQANPVVAATGAVNDAYQKSLGRAPDAAGMEYWQKQAAGGMSVDSIVNQIATSAESRLQGLYKTMFGRSADAAGLQYWLDKAKGGASWGAIGDAFANSDEAKRHMKIPGFANGGDFMGGLRIVGENGPELEATGPSRITNSQAFLSQLASPSQSNAVLAAAVERLTATVARQQAALDRIASSTEQHKELFDNSTAGGGPMIVQVVNTVATVAA